MNEVTTCDASGTVKPGGIIMTSVSQTHALAGMLAAVGIVGACVSVGCVDCEDEVTS